MREHPITSRRGRRPLRAAAALALAATAGWASTASAATSDAQITVTGGSLGLTVADFQPQGATLTGAAQTIATTPAGPWTAVDARGTGAGWSVVASAGPLVSAGTPNRVIDSANLAITTGAITAGTGADPATGISGASAAAFTAPTGPGQTNVALLATPGPHRGSYSFTPQLDVTVPANALPAPPGVPYTSTLPVPIS